jgi:hypothetical protein
MLPAQLGRQLLLPVLVVSTPLTVAGYHILEKPFGPTQQQQEHEIH